MSQKSETSRPRLGYLLYKRHNEAGLLNISAAREPPLQAHILERLFSIKSTMRQTFENPPPCYWGAAGDG